MALLGATFSAPSAMVDIAYEVGPSTGGFRRFCSATKNLQRALHRSFCKGKLWGHIWTVHFP